MKKILLSILFLYFLAGNIFAQTIINRDPVIDKMVGEISNERIKQDILKLVSFYTRHNLSDQASADKGIGASWNWLKTEIEKSVAQSGGRLSVAYDNYTAGGEGERIVTETHLKNLVATLKGTDPTDDRIIVISAHIDSRADLLDDSTSFAPGANDDGSGIAAILEMIRIMSKHEFPATFVFTIVSGEEHGLYGATYMAKKAKSEKWNIIAMLNNDMIGNSGSSGTMLNDNMRVRVFSEGIPAFETEEMMKTRLATSGENDSKSRQLARYIKEIGERYVDQLTVSLIYRNDRFGRNGDHTPFCKEGFTAVRITEFNENYDRTHKVPRIENGVQLGDLPEYVDIDYVRKNAGINLATIANLALAPYEPEKVGMVVAGLSNSAELHWSAPSKGEKPEGYYVLMRETNSPVWEKKIFTTDLKITLPYSKDNYFFAVQSVDAEGHESLAVFPLPARR